MCTRAWKLWRISGCPVGSLSLLLNTYVHDMVRGADQFSLTFFCTVRNLSQCSRDDQTSKHRLGPHSPRGGRVRVKYAVKMRPERLIVRDLPFKLGEFKDRMFLYIESLCGQDFVQSSYHGPQRSQSGQVAPDQPLGIVGAMADQSAARLFPALDPVACKQGGRWILP